MQFASIVRMFDQSKIVTDCHEKSLGITARMCEVFSPELAAGGAKLRAASSSALGLGVNVGAESKRYVGVAEPGCDVRDGHARPAGA
jgi:hypothetical protein